MQRMKRGLAAPLFFLALSVAALGTVYNAPLPWLATLLCMAGVGWALGTHARQDGSPALTVAVLGFAIWVVATNAWANPSYTNAAIYHPAFLAGGFLVGRRAMNEASLFMAAIAFALVLAGWALWQVAQGEARGQALFAAPATLAATINLLLVPGLVLVTQRARKRWFGVALVVLAAGLAAAASRGGWLALAAGLACALILLRRAGAALGGKSAALVVGILVLGALLPVLLPAQNARHTMFGEGAAQSSLSRVGLYRLALDGVDARSLPFGAGYLSFHYLLDSRAMEVPGYDSATTYFVHNDYLQALLELGIPGLLGMILLAVLPLARAWSSLPRLDEGKRYAAIGLCAGAASMAVHALVDFPFHLPICLLLYGCALGALDAMARTEASMPLAPAEAPRQPRLRRAVVVGIAASAAWLLILPAAAEATAWFGHRQWREDHAQGAAWWFEVARRIAPREWRYHWYAGQFWFGQAEAGAGAGAANQADRAFAAGDAANPREVANVLGRIATHRRFRGVLMAPADPDTMREWVRRAMAIAPRDPVVREQATLALKELSSAQAPR